MSACHSHSFVVVARGPPKTVCSPCLREADDRLLTLFAMSVCVCLSPYIFIHTHTHTLSLYIHIYIYIFLFIYLCT